MKKLKELKKMIEETLSVFQETRDSDQVLMETIRKNYFSVAPRCDANGEQFFVIPVDKLRSLPNKDNIKRIRAKFNQVWLYISENPEIRRKRRLSEEKYRQFLWY